MPPRISLASSSPAAVGSPPPPASCLTHPDRRRRLPPGLRPSRSTALGPPPSPTPPPGPPLLQSSILQPRYMLPPAASTLPDLHVGQSKLPPLHQFPPSRRLYLGRPSPSPPPSDPLHNFSSSLSTTHAITHRGHHSPSPLVTATSRRVVTPPRPVPAQPNLQRSNSHPSSTWLPCVAVILPMAAALCYYTDRCTTILSTPKPSVVGHQTAELPEPTPPRPQQVPPAEFF